MQTQARISIILYRVFQIFDFGILGVFIEGAPALLVPGEGVGVLCEPSQCHLEAL